MLHNEGTVPLRSRTERIALYFCLPLLLVVTLANWLLWQRVQVLDRSLMDSSKEGLALTNQLRDSRGREDLVGKALQQAILERDAALNDAERSREDAESAHREAEWQRSAASRLRSQRFRELDRMREALGRIADTDRTPMGMVVHLTEDSLLFGFDRSELRPEDREILSRIAGVMLASYGFKAFVYGHADDQGPSDYNQTLSERRAAAVRDYLAQAGIPGDVLEAKGFGEQSPRVRGHSREARQKNRRVEIAIVDTIVNYQSQVPDSPSGAPDQ